MQIALEKAKRNSGKQPLKWKYNLEENKMALVRWEPFVGRNVWTGLAHLQNRMNRIFDDLDVDEDSSVVNWSPRVEITELEDRFEVNAELPGMSRDDIKIELKDNILSISGEKSAEREKKDRKLHICERIYGSFNRSFRIPSHVKGDEIKAGFKNGVLTISLPKEEEAKPKQIEIKAD